MYLEVGKTYIDRIGNLHKIVGRDNYSDFPYTDEENNNYTRFGNFFYSLVDDLDLVEEYQPSVQPTKPLPDIIDPVINEMCWDMVKVIGSKNWFNELKPALYEALKRYHKEYLDKPE